MASDPNQNSIYNTYQILNIQEKYIMVHGRPEVQSSAFPELLFLHAIYCLNDITTQFFIFCKKTQNLYKVIKKEIICTVYLAIAFGKPFYFQKQWLDS